MGRIYERTIRHLATTNSIVKPLVEALSKATSTAQHAWQVARNQNDYSIFSLIYQPLYR